MTLKCEKRSLNRKEAEYTIYFWEFRLKHDQRKGGEKGKWKDLDNNK
jgi:hypothetical protein